MGTKHTYPKHTEISSPLGPLTLVADGPFLTGIFFPGHWHMPPREFFGEPVDASDGLFALTAVQLGEYFRGVRTQFTLPYRADGNDFQKRVWALLERIPYGTTVTYGELAAELGEPAMAQAVGTAVGRNPLSVVIPCHRVIGRDGSLTGYAGGLANKRTLLDLEEPATVKESRLF